MNELLTRVDEPTAEHSVHQHGMRQGQEQPENLQNKVLGITSIERKQHYLQRNDACSVSREQVTEPGTNSEIQVPCSLLRNFQPKLGKIRLPELVNFHKLHNLSTGFLAQTDKPKSI